MEASGLQCSCVVEALDECGQPLKKAILKAAVIDLGRNEIGDVVLRVSHAGGVAGPFTLREHAVHSRFAREGRATIRLIRQRTHLLVSNCPPAHLQLFLRSLSVKVTARGTRQGARPGMLPDNSLGFHEISPLSESDLQQAGRYRAAQRPPNVGSGATPCRTSGAGRPAKRKLVSDVTNTREQSTSKAGHADQHRAEDHCTARPSKRLRGGANSLNSTLSGLSAEQESVLELVRGGHSVFFTGSAGTGKSFLLKKILAALPPETTVATASTGSAACLIGGSTLHSFAGIGTGQTGLQQCVQMASREPKAGQWKKCHCLIIDEISMIEADYFEKLEGVARAVRQSKQPFGGIQLVLCGDFLQLPPVCKQGARKYSFQAQSWRRCVTHCIELTEIYRQSDKQFIAVLQNIRIGRCPPAVTSLLKATSQQQIEGRGVQATRLYTHTEDVESTNNRELTRLPGMAQVFKASDSEGISSQQLDSLCPVARSIELKIGAQVMLTKNIDVSIGLVNGARGVVTGFDSSSRGHPKVCFISGQHVTVGVERFPVKLGGGKLASRKQLPLRLAWAISIHKSQGMTLDCVEVSLARAFEDGQAYVALSRARALASLRVIDFRPSCVRAHQAALDFYRALRKMRRNYIT